MVIHCRWVATGLLAPLHSLRRAPAIRPLRRGLFSPIPAIAVAEKTDERAVPNVDKLASAETSQLDMDKQAGARPWASVPLTIPGDSPLNLETLIPDRARLVEHTRLPVTPAGNETDVS